MKAAYSQKDKNNDINITANGDFFIGMYSITEKQAGTLTVKNLSAHEDIVESADVIKNDTLLIHFIPKQDSLDHTFSIYSKELTKVNDSIFVVPRMDSGTHEVELMVSDTIGFEVYQAKKDLIFNVPKSYIVTPIIVEVSSDLKPFVDVELSYTDKEGFERKHLIKEEEWIKPDSVIIYKYENAEGRTAWSGKVPEGCKILGEEKYASYPYFIMDARFLDIKTNITTTFSARYIPKSNITSDRDKYVFSHGIDRMSAKISIPETIVIDNYTSLSFDMSDKTITKENITPYLYELSQTPDVKKFNISTMGEITAEE